MSQNILFQFEDAVKENQGLNTFLASQKGGPHVLVNNNEVVVVVKDSEKELSLEEVRMFAGNLVKKLIDLKVNTANVKADSILKYAKNESDETLTAFVEGFNLGQYQFIKYKSKEVEKKVTLNLIGENINESAVQIGEVRAAATAFSRDLMNDTANELNPETFPEVLKEAFSNTDVEVTVYDKKEIEAREMNGILAVSRGSKYEPRFVELKYVGDASKPLVSLVGKGVTFDTGGISLKSGRDLSDMRLDMGGAAAVSGALKLLADSKAKVNVVGLLQIVENMPDKDSILPGDVIRYKDGQTVQIGNTDAEGRLILADGLLRAQELKADYIVNIATLTGAAAVALGSKIGAVMGDLREAELMKDLGKRNGDHVWPLPLIDAYESYLDSDYADFSNISNKGEAGAITAGLFLRRFVAQPEKWLHVDMAGVMESKNEGYYGNSATGFGARLLGDYVVKKSL